MTPLRGARPLAIDHGQKCLPASDVPRLVWQCPAGPEWASGPSVRFVSNNCGRVGGGKSSQLCNPFGVGFLETTVVASSQDTTYPVCREPENVPGKAEKTEGVRHFGSGRSGASGRADRVRLGMVSEVGQKSKATDSRGKRVSGFLMAGFKARRKQISLV